MLEILQEEILKELNYIVLFDVGIMFFKEIKEMDNGFNLSIKQLERLL